MSFNSHRLYSRTFCIFSLLYAVSFFMFYFNNYLLFEEALYEYSAHYDTFEYVRYAISDLIKFSLPALSATLLLPLAFTVKAYKLYPLGLALSASSLFYNIPYYYLYYLSAYRYDSIESITISLLISVLISLLYALYSLALAYIARLVFFKRGGELPGFRTPAPPFLLSKSLSAAIFSAVLIQFILTLSAELFDAITFFIEYADTYRIGELLYILGRLVYILLCMIFSQWLCVFVHGKVIAKRFADTKTDID